MELYDSDISLSNKAQYSLSIMIVRTSLRSDKILYDFIKKITACYFCRMCKYAKQTEILLKLSCFKSQTRA